jgi:hypothetical protein
MQTQEIVTGLEELLKQVPNKEIRLENNYIYVSINGLDCFGIAPEENMIVDARKRDYIEWKLTEKNPGILKKRRTHHRMMTSRYEKKKRRAVSYGISLKKEIEAMTAPILKTYDKISEYLQEAGYRLSRIDDDYIGPGIHLKCIT